jgi:tRNA 2-thiouridine synthesizing protein B
MSILHVVNKSPFEKSSLDSCLLHAKEGASILFIEDAVYAALKGTAFSNKVQNAAGKCKVYALGPDIKARGMDTGKVIDGVEFIDYPGFVELAAKCDNVHSWV